MALHLILSQRLDTPRKLRFPGRFLDDIAALVGSVGLEVITRVHKVKGKRPQSGRGLREDIEPARQGHQSCPVLPGYETTNPICWMGLFFQYHFLSTYCVYSPVLGARDTTVNKTDPNPCP